MNRLKLTIATTDYDHFRDFRTGAVRAEGIDHNWLTLGHHVPIARRTDHTPGRWPRGRTGAATSRRATSAQ